MKNHILFTDLETGGLSQLLDNGQLGCQYYPIFQIAILTTDNSLTEVAPPLVLHIHQTEEMIARCDPWALEHHEKTGILKASRESGLSLLDAEQAIIDHLAWYGIEQYNRKNKTGPVMAGNSITLDRMFISAQLPRFNDYMHYRQIDISAVHMLGRMLGQELLDGFNKTYAHDALLDIRESLRECRHYGRTLFKADI